MPRIQPYESQLGAQAEIPSPQASGAEAYGPGVTQLGQAVVQAGSNLATAHRIIQENNTRAAVTDVHTMLSKARADYTAKAIEAESKADPSDHDLWGKFYHGGDEDNPQEGSLKWYLDSYGEQITDETAKQVYERGRADLSSQFGIHFAQVQARMAGVHAQNQGNKLIDSLQTAVQTDPSQHEAALAQFNAALNDRNSDYWRGNVSYDDREKIRQHGINQISASTVDGMIRDSPQHALHSLETGEWDKLITGEQKVVLERRAETAIRADEVEAQRKEAEALKAQKRQYDATDQSLTAQQALFDGNPNDPKNIPVTGPQINNLMLQNKLDANTGHYWLDKLEKNTHARTLKNDETLSREFSRQMWLNWGHKDKMLNLDKVRAAEIAGKLTTERYNWLEKQFRESETSEGTRLATIRAPVLAGFKGSITTSVLGRIDSLGDIKYGEFMEFATRREEELRQSNEDPSTLYQRDHKNYIGNYAKNYHIPMEERIKGISDELGMSESITTPVSPNIQAPSTDVSKFGTRPDGTPKGLGYFGALRRPHDEKISTELSTDDPIDSSGKKILHPLIVPSLTRPELEYLLADEHGNKVMEERIYDKAAAHARERIKAGKTPFAQTGEQQPPPSGGGVPPDKQRKPGETPKQYLDRTKKP